MGVRFATQLLVHWARCAGAFELIISNNPRNAVPDAMSQIGKNAAEGTKGHEAVPTFEETVRDFKSFEKRRGALPEQQVQGTTGIPLMQPLIIAIPSYLLLCLPYMSPFSSLTAALLRFWCFTFILNMTFFQVQTRSCSKYSFVFHFQEGDPVDVRGYLHRDGSVIMQISLEDLQNPQALYQTVGAPYLTTTMLCTSLLYCAFAHAWIQQLAMGLSGSIYLCWVSHVSLWTALCQMGYNFLIVYMELSVMVHIFLNLADFYVLLIIGLYS